MWSTKVKSCCSPSGKKWMNKFMCDWKWLWRISKERLLALCNCFVFFLQHRTLPSFGFLFLFFFSFIWLENVFMLLSCYYDDYNRSNEQTLIQQVLLHMIKHASLLYWFKTYFGLILWFWKKQAAHLFSWTSVFVLLKIKIK